MKKLFIILSIILVALLLAIELYVQSDAFADRIRPAVVDGLRAVLGKEVGIGRIRANFIPLYLEASDITLLDDRGTQAASIRKVKVYINPFLLLVKKIRLPSIVLFEPRINAERAKDGELNLTPLIARIQSNIARMQAEGPSGYSVLVRTVSINQGGISYKDSMTSTQVMASGLQVVTRINLAGESVKVTVKNAEVQVAAPAYPEVTGNLTAAVWFEHGRVRIEAFELRTTDTTLALSGNLGPPTEPALDLRLRIRSGPQTIRRFTPFWKPAKKEEGPHVEASAVIEGTLAQPAVSGTLKLTGMTFQGLLLQDAALSFGYRDKSLSLDGVKWKLVRGSKSIIIDSINAAIGYSERGLDIKRFDLTAGDLSLRMSGRADPLRGFDAVVTAESVDKGRTLSFLTTVPLEGGIAIKGYLTGALNAPLFDGTFYAGSLSIRGVLFDNAGGRVQYRDKKISLVSADIHQQTSRYIFDGSVDLAGKDPVISARLKVLRSDVVSVVALFYEPIPLRLSATGELIFNGTLRDFTGSGRLALDSGSVYGEAFSRGTIVAALTKERISFPQVQLNKGDGTVEGTGWIGFDGSYSADIVCRGVRLSQVDHLAGVPVDGRFDLTVGGMGTFSHPQASASLDVEELIYNQAGLGSLSAGAEISEGALTFKTRLDERATVTARLGLSKPYAWTAQARFSADALDPFLAFGKKELQGRLRLIAEGSLSASGAGADLSVLSGSAEFKRLGLVVGDYRIDNAAEAAVTVQSGRLAISSLEFTGPGTKIAVTGGARLMKVLDLSIAGTANLSLFRLMFREVEHADGLAEVKLNVNEAWTAPEVAGTLILKNGEIKIKDVPQRFSSLQGKLAIDQSRIVVESLTGEVGGGSLSASGWAQLSGFALQDFSTKASFESVTVRYPEGLTSTLSGNLSYDGDASEQSLNGDVTIKRARYDKRVEWKSMLVEIGKGLYQKKKTEIGWIGETQINIRFSGKDSILFQNNLAKVPLSVDMFLRGTVNQPQLFGRVEALKGSVYFRKNEFKILHASADFVDPNRINPVLDVQAEIQVREYRVRLAVSGTADRAVVTLLSDPSLPDSDVLTLLALGKTGTELKGRETSVGMSEAASFATGQFQDFVESRARSLTGLDRFQVDPYVSAGDTSVPRVTVGKEIIQDKLYVTYSSNVGSPTPEQVFRIEYILSRHFSLVGERNELGNTGADVKYRFEFR